MDRRSLVVASFFPPISSRFFSSQQQLLFIFSLSLCRSLDAALVVLYTSLPPVQFLWQHNFNMAAIPTLTEPIGMGKQMHIHHEGIEIEKVPDEHDLIERMNMLDPPVTPEEERKVRRKIDMRLPPFLLVLYMFTWLDRGNLGKLHHLDSLDQNIFLTGPRSIRPDEYQEGSSSYWP